jgi:hypothetical protein
MSFRYQARMVSGLATRATCSRDVASIPRCRSTYLRGLSEELRSSHPERDDKLWFSCECPKSRLQIYPIFFWQSLFAAHRAARRRPGRSPAPCSARHVKKLHRLLRGSVRDRVRFYSNYRSNIMPIQVQARWTADNARATLRTLSLYRQCHLLPPLVSPL